MKDDWKHEFDIDSLRDTWYKTSYLLDRRQSMNGMARKRFLNYKKQPLEFRLGNFKGSFASLGINPTVGKKRGRRRMKNRTGLRQPSSERRAPMVTVRWPTPCGSPAST